MGMANNEKNIMEETYSVFNQTPSQFLERRIAATFGVNSNAMKALDLVKEEMCAERGFVRDDGQDFYNHCIEVAITLMSHQVRDEDAICAALMHDLIEDVEGYTEITIARMFNPNTAYLVMLVTKKHGEDYKNPKLLKEYLDIILGNMYASAIKTADRMHNMQTLREKGFEARYRKAIETETYYMPFFKECRSRYPRYESLFYAARSQISPLIFEIKSFYGEIQRLQWQLAEYQT